MKLLVSILVTLVVIILINNYLPELLARNGFDPAAWMFMILGMFIHAMLMWIIKDYHDVKTIECKTTKLIAAYESQTKNLEELIETLSVKAGKDVQYGNVIAELSKYLKKMDSLLSDNQRVYDLSRLNLTNSEWRTSLAVIIILKLKDKTSLLDPDFVRTGKDELELLYKVLTGNFKSQHSNDLAAAITTLGYICKNVNQNEVQNRVNLLSQP